MKIEIIRNVKLVDGEQVYDRIETVDTKKSVSFTLCRKYDLEGNVSKYIYMQVGTFLDKDFKDFDISEKDMIYIEGEID